MLNIVGPLIEIEQIFNVVGVITNFWQSWMGIKILNCFILVIKNWPNNIHVSVDEVQT
jgi:hypothetical protein